MSLRSFATLGLALALTVGTSGCIVIPTPEFNSGAARANINKKTPARFEPGTTTREDVILSLGEPDVVSPDERKLAYRSEKVCGFWILAGGYSATGGTIEKDRYLVLAFDAQGRLLCAERSAHWFTSADARKVLLEEAGQDSDAADEAMCRQHRGEWFPHVDGFKQPRDATFMGNPGVFRLAESDLEFITRAQLANAEPALTLPYASLVECRLDKFFLGRRLVVRTRSGEVHSFVLHGSGGVTQDKRAMLAACDFIHSHIPPSSPE